MYEIEIREVPEAIKKLTGENQAKINAANEGIHESGKFLKAEIVMSISGQRAEPRSFDTGLFAGNVDFDNSELFSSKIFTNLDYPVHLEYGTSTMAPRRHFNNSLARNRVKINKFIQDKINQAKLV